MQEINNPGIAKLDDAKFKLELLWDISETPIQSLKYGYIRWFPRAYNEPVASLKLNLVTTPTWAPQTQSYTVLLSASPNNLSHHYYHLDGLMLPIM